MAVTDKLWDGAASRFPDSASYCKSCLIDLNPPGKDKVQALCKLPIKEPNGDINSNALSSAAGALNGARNTLKGVPPDVKKRAARALVNAYHVAKMDVPDSVKRMV